MNLSIPRIFVHGFPGLYGGATTELHHQIVVWKQIGLDVHLIPIWPALLEPLYNEMIAMGVIIHEPNDFSKIEPGDPVISFCNGEFLDALPQIRQRSRRTIFVNCMTWLFEKEKECMANGLISLFLYQNQTVLDNQMPILRKLNDDPGIQFLSFKPYFDGSKFEFTTERSSEYFGCGRISRQDADKFSDLTLHIYEYFVAPKVKNGLFLGFDYRSQQKIGTPYDWIRTAKDQNEVSQQKFYNHCEIILQPTDTTENWPRIGFEAMASGSVLIVDNRGGWKQMIEHGKTGWLCDNARDFIYYASKMAYEPQLRRQIAEDARISSFKLGGIEASIASWQNVFDKISLIPE